MFNTFRDISISQLRIRTRRIRTSPILITPFCFSNGDGGNIYTLKWRNKQANYLLKQCKSSTCVAQPVHWLASPPPPGRSTLQTLGNPEGPQTARLQTYCWPSLPYSTKLDFQQTASLGFTLLYCLHAVVIFYYHVLGTIPLSFQEGNWHLNWYVLSRKKGSPEVE